MANMNKSAGSYPSAASQSQPQPQPQPQLNQILYGDYDNIFNAQRYFSVDKSTAHLFDVVSGNGIMRSNVRGDELVEIVKVSSPTTYIHLLLTLAPFSKGPLDKVERMPIWLTLLQTDPPGSYDTRIM